MKVKEYYMYLYPVGTILELTKPMGNLGKPAGARFVVCYIDNLCQLHVEWLPPYEGEFYNLAGFGGLEKNRKGIILCLRRAMLLFSTLFCFALLIA